jgi:hypothetical protein
MQQLGQLYSSSSSQLKRRAADELGLGAQALGQYCRPVATRWNSSQSSSMIEKEMNSHGSLVLDRLGEGLQVLCQYHCFSLLE